jgi:hypothetical protein
LFVCHPHNLNVFKFWILYYFYLSYIPFHIETLIYII